MTNAESSTPVSSALAVRDQAGNYYLISQGMLEQCRVPAEHKAEVERLLAVANDAEGDADVQGYFWPILLLGLAGCRAAAIHNSSPKEEVLVPDLSSVLSSSASPETIR